MITKAHRNRIRNRTCKHKAHFHAGTTLLSQTFDTSGSSIPCCATCRIISSASGFDICSLRCMSWSSSTLELIRGGITQFTLSHVLLQRNSVKSDVSLNGGYLYTGPCAGPSLDGAPKTASLLLADTMRCAPILSVRSTLITHCICLFATKAKMISYDKTWHGGVFEFCTVDHVCNYVAQGCKVHIIGQFCLLCNSVFFLTTKSDSLAFENISLSMQHKLQW